MKSRPISPSRSGRAQIKGKKFLILRHAESTANVSGVLAGRIDPTALTEKGLETAVGLRGVVENFRPDLTRVSPMLRCRQTIESAAGNGYELDDRLIEMDYGSWSGRSLKSLARKPEWRKIQTSPDNFTFPRGESFVEAWHRIGDLLGEIQATDFERLLLVTHGDISRMIITHLLGEPLNNFQRFMIEPGSHSLLITTPGSNTSVGYLNRIAFSKESADNSSQLQFKVGGE